MLAVRYVLLNCMMLSFCSGMDLSRENEKKYFEMCKASIDRSHAVAQSITREKSHESKVIAQINRECFEMYKSDPEKACQNLTAIAEQQNGFKQLAALYQKHRVGAYPLWTQCARLDMIDLVSLLFKNEVLPEADENPWLWVRSEELVHLFHCFYLKGTPDPKTGDTLAHKAAFRGDLEVLQALRTIKKINHNGETPLFKVIENIQDIQDPVSIAAFFLDRAPRMRKRPRHDGFTPLLYLQHKQRVNGLRTDLSSTRTLGKLFDLGCLLRS